jgi:hypothetical protein
MSESYWARRYDANPKLQAQLKASQDTLRQAEAELRDFEATPQQAEVDNRFRLNTRYEGQKSSRSRNVVQDLGDNWVEQPGQVPSPGGSEVTLFNGQWLSKNQLNNEAPAVVTTDNRARPEDASQPGTAKPGQPVIVFGGGKPTGDVQAQPKAPEVAQGSTKAKLVESRQATVTADEEMVRSGRHADETVLRYRTRLEEQAANQPALADKGSAIGLRTDDVFSADLDILPFAPDSQAQAATAAAPGGVAAPTGLASLQLELPKHEEDFYQVYRFSTPRGEVEITAWAVSENLLTRLLELAAVLVAVGVLGWCVRLARAGRFAGLWGATGSTLMICVGLLALLFGVLPMAGLTALVAGIAVKIRRAAAGAPACGSAAAGQPITAEVVPR